MVKLSITLLVALALIGSAICATSTQKPGSSATTNRPKGATPHPILAQVVAPAKRLVTAVATVPSVAAKNGTSGACFQSTDEWRADLTKRVQDAGDAIGKELENSMGFFGVIRRLGLRLARRNLVAMKDAIRTSMAKANELGQVAILTRAETDLNNIAGTFLKRGGKWTSRSCCYKQTKLTCGSQRAAPKKQAKGGK